MKLAVTRTVGKFLLSEAYLRILRGPRGEGKTTAVYADDLRATDGAPLDQLPMRVIVVRDTWTNLNRSTIENLRELQRRGLAVEWRDQDREAIVAGGRVHYFFLGMDTVKDLSKFQGFKAARLWIEEPAPAADLSGGLPVEVFSVGATSLRQEPWRSRVTITMNPPDEEHWSVRMEERLRALKRKYPAIRFDLAVFDIPKGENRHISQAKRDEWRMALELGGRGDLVARLIEGQIGTVERGERVTPEYSDALHLAPDPLPILDGVAVIRSFDFGLNPTCTWAQITPSGFLHVLGCRVGENMGMEQFVHVHLRPWERTFLIAPESFDFVNTGDPAGAQREQSNSEQSAVRMLEALLPGFIFDPASNEWESRKQAVKNLLGGPTIRGRGRVQLDPEEAQPIRKALRGGAHYPLDGNGNPIATVQAFKRASGLHSHPFDTLSYIAQKFFAVPLSAPRTRRQPVDRMPIARHGWLAS